MAEICSLWVWVSDEGGNEALEIIEFNPTLKNPIGKIEIKEFAFYEQLEKGRRRLYKSGSPNSKSLIPE